MWEIAVIAIEFWTIVLLALIVVALLTWRIKGGT